MQSKSTSVHFLAKPYLWRRKNPLSLENNIKILTEKETKTKLVADKEGNSTHAFFFPFISYAKYIWMICKEERCRHLVEKFHQTFSIRTNEKEFGFCFSCRFFFLLFFSFLLFNQYLFRILLPLIHNFTMFHFDSTSIILVLYLVLYFTTCCMNSYII